MLRSAIVAVLILFVLGTVPVRADEIKLKSGETIKNCKVKSKKKGRWIVVLLDGSRKIIKESDVVSHLEKPTIADELDARLKKVGKKDKDALLAIGREAMSVGARKQGVKALRKVTRLDKNNIEAHQLLGDEKCEDGKWRGGRTLAKYRAAQRDAEMKAKGWKKIKGKWVDPMTARNIKDGLVKFKGEWYTKKFAANLQAGMIYLEGTWYNAADREKLDKGKLKYKGKWLDVRDINVKIRENGDAWRLVGKHFIVIGAQGRKKLLICLQHLDDTWEEMREIFGTEPSTVKEDDKIQVFVTKNSDAYRGAHGQHGGDNRVALYSNAYGGYYSSRSGAILTYYYSIDYLVQWTQHAGACAFQAKLLGYDNCPSNFYDALACYIQGFDSGRYQAYNPMFFNGFRSWADPGDPMDFFQDFNLAIKVSNPSRAEGRFARLGFVIHFLRQKYPEVLKSWAAMVAKNKGETEKLVAKAKKMLKGKDLAKEFKAFLQQYLTTHVDPTPRLRK